MSDIVERTGVAFGSLYQYFPDKTAIIGTLAERYNAVGRDCVRRDLSVGEYGCRPASRAVPHRRQLLSDVHRRARDARHLAGDASRPRVAEAGRGGRDLSGGPAVGRLAPYRGGRTKTGAGGVRAADHDPDRRGRAPCDHVAAEGRAPDAHAVQADVAKDLAALEAWKGAREIVMPGLVPGIHVLGAASKKDVDGRDEPGHDVLHCANPSSRRAAAPPNPPSPRSG